MTISWLNGKQATSVIKQDAHGCFTWDKGNFCQVEQFPANTKLSGVFEGGSCAHYDGSLTSACALTLSIDGKYNLTNAGQAYGGTPDYCTETGTYTISGNVMTLNSERASRQVLTFPYDDGTRGPSPRKIMFDRMLMNHQPKN